MRMIDRVSEGDRMRATVRSKVRVTDRVKVYVVSVTGLRLGL